MLRKLKLLIFVQVYINGDVYVCMYQYNGIFFPIPHLHALWSVTENRISSLSVSCLVGTPLK